MTKVLLWTLGCVNALLFLLMGADKWKAKHEKRRIPEATLFVLALLGGSAGGILGMLVFRHKTRHKSFTLGFGAIFLIEAAFAACLLLR